MYYVRKFKQGRGKRNYDPRLKTYAVYKCDHCGDTPWIDITYNGAFDFDKQRKCPTCGVLDVNDHLNTLKSRINQLTEERDTITIEIERLCEEVENIKITK
jgi:ribosomal protein L32